jgi:hypothetical protein
MRRLSIVILILAIVTLLCYAPPSSTSQSARNVLRMWAKVTIGSATTNLARKRFYLIKGSREQNKALIEMFEHRPVVPRECYFRNAGASEALIKWLKDNDCESVYCREIQQEDLEGKDAIPEFVTAMTAGEKEFGSRELARKWLTVNLPEKLRSGFYRERQNELQSILKQAEASSGARVLSVMTSKKGVAYFTDLEPGSYTLSNIIPTESGSNSLLWNCDIVVKQDVESYANFITVSNRGAKCLTKEKPLPVCETPK